MAQRLRALAALVDASDPILSTMWQLTTAHSLVPGNLMPLPDVNTHANNPTHPPHAHIQRHMRTHKHTERHTQSDTYTGKKRKGKKAEH